MVGLIAWHTADIETYKTVSSYYATIQYAYMNTIGSLSYSCHRETA